MGDLKTKAQSILTEKNTKIIPSNIKEGITIFDVTGSYNGDTELLEKDVNFYDYDGTLVYSYTANEFLTLTELPANPTHQGLTAQGWNWTLQEAKDFVTEYGECDIGQQYITDDGKTRIYITLEEGRTSPYLSFCGTNNSTIEVNWGDGNTETVTGKGNGTNENNIITLLHNYMTPGNYIITLHSTTNQYIGITSLYKNYGYYPILLSPVPLTEYTSQFTGICYLATITKIELGKNVYFYQNSLQYLYNLNTITCPNNMSLNTLQIRTATNLKAFICPRSSTAIVYSIFDECYSIKKVIFSAITKIQDLKIQSINMKKAILPPSITSLPYQAFYKNYNLQKIILPNTLTILGTNCISNCYNLTHLDIPKGIASIVTSAFSTNYSMLYYNFSKHEAVPTLANVSAFNNIPADCKIIVPDNLYEDWIVAQNWSDIASHIVKASEYFN